MLNHFRRAHPRLVGFKRALRTSTHLCIVLEKCSGSLIEYMCEQPSWNLGLPEAFVREQIAQMLCGIHFLHSNAVVHRDIKARLGAAARGACAR